VHNHEKCYTSISFTQALTQALVWTLFVQASCEAYRYVFFMLGLYINNVHCYPIWTIQMQQFPPPFICLFWLYESMSTTKMVEFQVLPHSLCFVSWWLRSLWPWFLISLCVGWSSHNNVNDIFPSTSTISTFLHDTHHLEFKNIENETPKHETKAIFLKHKITWTACTLNPFYNNS
jgi:hypothetical protein